MITNTIKYIKIRQIAVFLAVALAFFSCEDFLEEPLQAQLTEESFPTTSADAVAATNAIYNTLREAPYHTGFYPVDDIMSDDAYKGSSPSDQATVVGAFENFEQDATNEVFSNYWRALYKGVRRANVVINNVPDIQMDQELKERLLGEAHFLRALFYFELVRAYGGVPLIIATTPDFDAERSTSEAVYNQVEADLEAAIEFLPFKSDYSPDNLGRATKGAAQALMAKISLYQHDFLKAEEYAMAVILSGEYSLEPNFEDANSVMGEHGVESVFEIGALGELEGIENGGNFYANAQGVRGNPNRGWGFNRPSIELMNAFEENDPRLNSTVIFLGEEIDGVTINGDSETPDEKLDADGNVIELEVYNQKVWTPGIRVAPTQGHNRRVIRYADVLLMAAEALNENNKPEQALVYLNMVRERARGGNDEILPDITTTNQEELREIIMHERRVELALEGHRFWDLVRTGRALEVLGPKGFIKGKHELFPIPQSERDLTNQRLEQNPMWN